MKYLFKVADFMSWIFAALLAFAALGIGVAYSQPVLNFDLETVSQGEGTQKTLVWSTVPAAESCTASGSWSGTKASSGTEVFPAAVGGASFTLECTWAADDTARVHWTNATQNEDGTPFSEEQWGSLVIKYSMVDPETRDVSMLLENACESNLFACVTVPNTPPNESYEIEFLSPGFWAFVAHYVNADGVWSRASQPAFKETTAASTLSRTLSVIAPNPPANLTAE